MRVLGCPYIRFKAPEIQAQWESGENLHPSLVVKILAVARAHYQLTNRPVVITSLIRPKTTDSGVHAAGRGCDFRIRDIAAPEHRTAWLTWINRTFPYHGKAGCQTAMIHGEGDNEHLHVQVGPGENVPGAA